MIPRYVIQYMSHEHPEAGWTDMALFFATREGAEFRMMELSVEFGDKAWRVDPRLEPSPFVDGNSGTH